MLSFIVVGIGGMIGAFLRFLLGEEIGHWWQGPFPLGTLTINLIGCFVLSWLNTIASHTKYGEPIFRLGFGTGLIGSFTTFSTFSVESVELLQNRLWFDLSLYLGLTIIGGLTFVWLGHWLALNQIEYKKEGGRIS